MKKMNKISTKEGNKGKLTVAQNKIKEIKL
jgi:hypothetical protein